ncbi:MAG: glycosyltransferase family 4 protein [Candidatus Aenigmatarchaeota archaeon]
MENSSKKKVLIFLHKFPYPDTDSTKFRIWNSVILPLKKHFDIKIFVVTYENIKKEDLIFLKNIAPLDFYIFPKWRFFLNILLNLFSLRPFQTEMWFFKRVFLRFQEEAKKFDVIYIHTVRLGKYIEKLSPELREKIILDFNDSIAMHYLNGWKYYPLLLKMPILLEGLKLYFYEKKIFKMLNKFCIVSNFDKNFIIKNISEDIVKRKTFIVTYTSARTYDFNKNQNKLNIDLSKHYICFLGNLRYYPNYEGISHFLKDIWPKICEEIKELEFFIIGHVSKKISDEFKNVKRVQLLGFVEDIYPVLKNSLAVISPVRIGAGIQGKVIQAMAIGKLVISYPQGVNELDGFKNLENIIICKRNNEEDWLKYLKFILENEDKVIKIQEEAKKLFLEKFSIDSVSKRYFELFKEFLN